MPKTITQLDAASPADPNAVVAADNAAGTKTEKVTLQQIADLATATSLPSGTTTGEVLTWNATTSTWYAASGFLPAPQGPDEGDVVAWVDGEWMAVAPAPSGIAYPNDPADGDVLTYDGDTSEWIAAAPTGGTLPSTSVDGVIPVYSTSLSAWTGSDNAMSLGTVVLMQNNADNRVFVTDNPTYGTFGIRLTDGSDYDTNNAMEISTVGLVFPDNTVQQTAGIPAPSGSPNQGDVLTYDTGNWVAQAPSGSLPSGTNDNDVLTWDSGTSQWQSESIPAQLPTSASYGDVLAWSGSEWAAQHFTPSLPWASQGQVLIYDGASWVANSPFTYISASSGQYLYYDGSNWTAGNPLPTSGSTGDVLTYDNMTNTWSAQPPSGGGGGLTAVFAKAALDEAFYVLSASTYVTVAVQGNATYMVEGLAFFEVPGGGNDALMSLRLSGTTNDGNVWMDCDLAIDGQANNWVVGTDFSQSTLTVANNADPFNPQSFPIRFRGWVETLPWISSTNLAIHFGHSSGSYLITLKAGSWIKAVKVL